MTNIYRPIIFFADQNKIIISRLTKKFHHTFRVTIEQKHQIKTTVLGRQNFFSSILRCDINVTDHYVISCQQGRCMIQTTKQHAVTLYLTVWSSSLYFYSLFFCLTAALPQLTGIQNVPLANGRSLFFLHKAKHFFFFPAKFALGESLHSVSWKT